MSESIAAVPEEYYPPAFLPDGYNRTVIIDGVRGIHPPIELTYRMSRGLEDTEEIGFMYLGTGEATEGAYKALARRILKWDQPERVTPENIKRMNGPLLTKVINVVCGRKSPDRERIDQEEVSEPGSDYANQSEEVGNSSAE